jgi:hypothetical protein
MRHQARFTLVVSSILLFAALFVLASSAGATSVRVRGTGNYGDLTTHQVSAPSITGNGSSLLSDFLYQCQYDGTPCPVNLTNPDPNLTNTDPTSCAKANTITDLSGPAPCFDLFVTIKPNAVFPPGSTLSLTVAGFTNPIDQFGLFVCDPSSPQGFGAMCTANVPSGCQSAVDGLSPSSNGKVNIPGACLAPGTTFYFDETSNNSVSASLGSVTATPEPNSFLLLGFGLVSVLLLSKRPLRA